MGAKTGIHAPLSVLPGHCLLRPFRAKALESQSRNPAQGQMGWETPVLSRPQLTRRPFAQTLLIWLLEEQDPCLCGFYKIRIS
jgi:hypothetical protein